MSGECAVAVELDEAGALTPSEWLLLASAIVVSAAAATTAAGDRLLARTAGDLAAAGRAICNGATSRDVICSVIRVAC